MNLPFTPILLFWSWPCWWWLGGSRSSDNSHVMAFVTHRVTARSTPPQIVDNGARRIVFPTEARRRTRRIPSSSCKLRLPTTTTTKLCNELDEETPEQRQARMEQVRKIQKVFYQTSSASSVSTVTGTKEINDAGTTTNSAATSTPHAIWSWVDNTQDPSIMYNVPLWRVQWTELPGYQNVLHVHVPHYTHMFRQLLYQNKNSTTWYFGHVYLPGGSDNLSNPLFALPTTTTSTDTTEFSHQHTSAKATTIGTLMRITDYQEDRHTGQLTLVVQACARIQILQAQQQIPYAIADVIRMLENWESSKVEYPDTNQELVTTSQWKRAQAIAAVYEGRLLTDLEFQPTRIFGHHHHKDKHDTSTNNSERSSAAVPRITALCNYDKSVTVDWNDINTKVNQVFLQHAGITDDDDVSTTLTYNRKSLVDNDLIHLERNIWIQVDVLTKFLEILQPNTRIPIPTQLLGLLPEDDEENNPWPKGFRLHKYTQHLEDQNVTIGTATKTPFVRVVHQYPKYPLLRRCSRLSYVIWILMDSISVSGTTTKKPLDRQHYLEIHSIQRRLQLTLEHIGNVNALLHQIIQDDAN
jgi:Lon protease-like protein